MAEKLNPMGLGIALAIVSAIIMLVLGIFSNVGIYTGAVEMMQKWHMLFSPSIGGIIGGMIEAAIISFILGYLFGWIYNKFA
jgi:hypothetical protein